MVIKSFRLAVCTANLKTSEGELALSSMDSTDVYSVGKSPLT